VLLTSIAVARAQQREPGEPTSTSEAARSRPASSPDDDESWFGATARVTPERSGEHVVGPRETQVLHGSLGDSFDAVESLPGTVPVFSGVPYLLVRGAPPAGTAQYYDGVPVPALFHLALGPEITDPSLIGGLTFHPGVAPARYGRHIGGALIARGPSAAPRASGGVEGRLLDAHGLLRLPEPALSLNARVGYPNLVLDAIDSSAVLAYWDYLARDDIVLDDRDRATIMAFGAGDRVGDRTQPNEDIVLQFHRALLRLERETAQLTVGAQVYAGYEQGRLGPDLHAWQARVGPSTWLELRRHGSRVRVGLDMEAKLAHVRHDQDASSGGAMMPAAEPGSPDSFLPDIEPDMSFTVGPEDIVDRTPLAKRGERNAVGAYAELALSPGGPFDVELGARSDLWMIAGRSEQSFDPRVLVRAHVTPALTLHAGAGMTHQGAVSPIPIPGMSDFELDHGLQSAVQTEAGVDLDLPGDFALSATGFYHRLSDVVFVELIVDCEGNSDPLAPLLFGPGLGRRVPLCERHGLPRADGSAYGGELLLRRNLTQRLSGWLSYTLAWADATAGDGTEFVPQYDVRHVINAVLTQDWGGGWNSGVRLHYRSGKPAVNTVFDFTTFDFSRLHTRLPAFFRLDLNLAYGWATSFGRLVVTLQFLNATFSREATKRDCSLGAGLRVVCEIAYQPAVILPNIGLRAEL
jgi:hypothetical protein